MAIHDVGNKIIKQQEKKIKCMQKLLREQQLIILKMVSKEKESSIYHAFSTQTLFQINKVAQGYLLILANRGGGTTEYHRSATANEQYYHWY